MTDLVVFSQSVQSRDVLIEGLLPGARYWVAPRENTVEALAAALSAVGAGARNSSPRLHIVGHGAPGGFEISGVWFSTDDGPAVHAFVEAVRLGGFSELILYGCEVSAGMLGAEFRDNLSSRLGIPVIASDTVNGRRKGGFSRWFGDAPCGSGVLAFDIASLAAYPHHLAQQTIDYTQIPTSSNGSLTQVQDGLNGLTDVSLTTGGNINFILDFGRDIDGTTFTSESDMGSDGNATFPASWAVSTNGIGFRFFTDSGSVNFSLDAFSIRATPAALDNVTVSMSGFRDGGGTAVVTQDIALGTVNLNTNTTLTRTSNFNNAEWQNVDIVTVEFNDADASQATRFGVVSIVVDDAVAAATPTITSATYDASTNQLVVTGTNFTATAGAANDVDASDITLTGEGGATYQLTDTSDVEITSATEFTLTLSATDADQVERILNVNGTSSNNATTYNIAGAAGFIADSAGTADLTGNGITVSNVVTPSITSATYDFSTGVVVVTGAGFKSNNGATNDIDLSLLTFGDGSGSYQLTSATDVEITSTTSFTFTLSGADKLNVDGLLDTNGTASGVGTYNLAAADNFNPGGAAATDQSDATGNGITVSNVAAPTLTSATFDWATGSLVLTGTNFVAASGATNDVDASLLTFTGDAGGTYTLTTTADVEVSSATGATITLSAADLLAVRALLDANGTSSDDSTTYNLAAADNWITGAAAATDIADATGNGITVSNVAAPTLTSATFDWSNGNVVLSGTNFINNPGGTNDVDASLLTFTGEGGGTYTLTDTADVEVTSSTAALLTLSATDLLAARNLLNQNGTTADSGTTYNLAAADNWITGAAASTNIADATGNAVTVSSVSNPTITSATVDYATGSVVVTGTNFSGNSGATNDVDASLLTFTGQGGATYTLTDTADVEVTSATQFTLTLSATDLLNVRGLLNNDGTTASDATTYNLGGADNWMPGADPSANIADATGNGITVSNYTAPTVTSATYDYNTNVLTVTGTNFTAANGATNDIDLSTITITGEGGGTYTLTTATDVEVTNATTFSATLSGADVLNVEGLLSQNGTSAASGTTYNVGFADNWLTAARAATDIADATGNGITVSNYAAPTLTSATFDWSNGNLVLTGTNLVAASGATNDVDASLLTFTGDGGGTYTLTDTSDVELTSATAATVSLSTTDLLAVRALLDANGTSSDGSTTYNLAAADNWLPGAPATTDIADATGNGITVSNVAAPTLTSATFDWSTGSLVLTGTNFINNPGATNDVDASLFTVTGEGGATYTLTDTADVEVTSGTSATLTLSATDLLAIRDVLNQNGTTADDTTTYNVAVADNWMTGAAASTDIADATGNGITVSNVSAPTITSATVDYATGSVVVTGTNFSGNAGATNDVDASLLTFTGQGGATYTLTDTADVEVTSATQFTLTLSATDLLNVRGLLNNDGTTASDTTTYNLGGADNWMPAADPSANIADATGNGITVSNYTAPTVTSATYDYNTNVLTVTGTNFAAANGATNDIDLSTITFTGEGGGTYTLTTATDVEVTNATTFSATLSGNDLINVEALLTQNGTSAVSGTTYNVGFADNWLTSARAATDIADATGNGITVSNYAAPTITSATFDWSNGNLVVTGTNLVPASGATNDVDLSDLTITGEGGSYQLTTATDVEITNATTFTATLSGTDLSEVRGILNRDGTQGSTPVVYNLAGAEDWITGVPAATVTADTTGNGITVSNVTAPAVTSATYDQSTGVLTLTGTNFTPFPGATNDVDISTITVTGGTGNATYAVTSASDVEITSATSIQITLSGADKTGVDNLLDQIGTTSTGGSTYNVALAEDWLRAADSAANIADTTITTTVAIAPTITSATYDVGTNSLVVTGTNFQANAGATNDVDASDITITGEGGGTYTLTDTADVERDSITQFTLSLSATDAAAVEQIFNNNGTSSTGGTTYNIAGADGFIQNNAGADTTGNGITVSNVAAPTITSATYNITNGQLAVTGTGLLSRSGATNDIDASLFTLTGEGGSTYTLTDTADVEITSGTAFTLTLSATDQEQVARILNKDGTTATAGTTYNLAGAEDWATGANASVNVADTTGNGITVSNAVTPTITSATYAAGTGVLTVTGTGFKSANGATNDIDLSTLTLGDGTNTYTLTTATDVEITSTTSFQATLSGADKTGVDNILNTDGTSNATGTYNLAAADNFNTGADAALNLADATGNAITVSGINDQPTFTGLDATPTFTEGGAAVQLDANAVVADTELDAGNNYNGATLTLARNGGANSDDVFANTGTLGALTEGGNLTVGGTTIGTVTTNSSGTLLLTFNASATSALVDTALQSITYSNSSDTPPANAQIDYTFSDGNSGSAQGTGGAKTATGSVTVSLTAVNDIPVIANIGGDSFTYDQSGNVNKLDQGTAATLTDVDSTDFNGGTLTVSISAGGDAAEDVLTVMGTNATLAATTAGANVTVDSNVIGTLGNNVAAGNNFVVNLNANATVARVQSLIQDLAYQNTDTTAPTSTSRTVDIVVTDGDGGTSATSQVTVGMNADPSLSGIAGTSATAQSQSTVILAPNANLTDDVFDADGKLTVQRTTNPTSNDTYGFSSSSFTVSGASLLTNGTEFATFSQSNGVLTVNFDADATDALVDSVLQGVTLRTVQQGSGTVRFSYDDEDGGAVATGDMTVTIVSPPPPPPPPPSVTPPSPPPPPPSSPPVVIDPIIPGDTDDTGGTDTGGSPPPPTVQTSVDEDGNSQTVEQTIQTNDDGSVALSITQNDGQATTQVQVTVTTTTSTTAEGGTQATQTVTGTQTQADGTEVPVNETITRTTNTVTTDTGATGTQTTESRTTQIGDSTVETTTTATQTTVTTSDGGTGTQVVETIVVSTGEQVEETRTTRTSQVDGVQVPVVDKQVTVPSANSSTNTVQIGLTEDASTQVANVAGVENDDSIELVVNTQGNTAQTTSPGTDRTPTVTSSTSNVNPTTIGDTTQAQNAAANSYTQSVNTQGTEQNQPQSDITQHQQIGSSFLQQEAGQGKTVIVTEVDAFFEATGSDTVTGGQGGVSGRAALNVDGPGFIPTNANLPVASSLLTAGTDLAALTSDFSFRGTARADQTEALVTNAEQNAVVDYTLIDLISITSPNVIARIGSGDDLVLAGDGQHVLYSASGADTLRGGGGNDVVVSDAGADQLFGDGGDDYLKAGADDDSLDGGLGNDQLLGDEGADTLIGGDGDDILTLGAGDDRAEGGANLDAVLFALAADGVTLSGTRSSATATGDEGSDTLIGAELAVFTGANATGKDRVTVIDPETAINGQLGFNEAAYLTLNPDVAAAVSTGQFDSGLQHYQSFGQAEGRNDLSGINEAFYLSAYGDVVSAIERGQFVSAQEHFLLFGQREGRIADVVFDEEFYLADNPDVAAAITNGPFQNAAQHFATHGAEENRASDPLFDPAYYLAQNPDVAAAIELDQFFNAYDHYRLFGQGEGRAASTYFDTQTYRTEQNLGTDVNPLEHFLLFGVGQGLTAPTATDF
ncbi:MAG: DUF4347 domain-containing protein [Alphaproteobacteria bacterium]|nr:DUF4347 domain-containing protein [Alphaproteobacteria bacterium]